VIQSKQKPKKISIFGSNGFEYVFLLKGGEDLRQDEGVMQIFGLVNNIFMRNITSRKNLAIQLYNVIPLSESVGLLQWLHNCDTLDHIINTHRRNKKIPISIEENLIAELAPIRESYKKTFKINEIVYYALKDLTLIQKVNIFESVIENTPGDDLAQILFHKSSNAESWLERRTNFSRSLAVMSIVGYVLGLGDRHTNNLMFERTNGKIIHIDFGDCFENAMVRDHFPEKIPFRLTRMFINALEVTGIEGTLNLLDFFNFYQIEKFGNFKEHLEKHVNR